VISARNSATLANLALGFLGHSDYSVLRQGEATCVSSHV
jgi:hypothetical protein